MSNLKPCPFCGSDDLESGGDFSWTGAWCNGCGAMGPNHYSKHGFEWNSRANRIEELERKLAKAVEALETIAKPKVGPDFDWTEDEVNKWRAVWYRKYADTACITLAELTGGKDE